MRHEGRSPDGDGHDRRFPASAHPEHETPLPKASIGHDNRAAGSNPVDSHQDMKAAGDAP
jgi:hypothetical protein